MATCGDRRWAAPKSHPGGVRGCRIRRSVAYIALRVRSLCGAMTACHRLRGGIFSAYRRRPRMSPTPRSAKYGATHSCNPSRGSENVRLRSSSPHRAHHRIALPRAATLAASPCATTRPAAPRCTAPPRSAARASPCRTAPPRHLTMRYRVPHCTTRRQLSPPPAELHCNAV